MRRVAVLAATTIAAVAAAAPGYADPSHKFRNP
jgi:hypothetical protein